MAVKMLASLLSLPVDLPTTAAPALSATTAAAAAVATYTRRRVFFRSLDEDAAVSLLQRFPQQALNSLSTAEWRRLGVPTKLSSFSSETREAGVFVQFLSPDEAAAARGTGASSADGGIELSVDMSSFPFPSIVGKERKGRTRLAAARSEVLWQCLCVQLTRGVGDGWKLPYADLGPTIGVYPLSMEKKLEEMALVRATDSLWKRYD